MKSLFKTGFWESWSDTNSDTNSDSRSDSNFKVHRE